MILIWGQRLFGKCEHVHGAFYVATKFVHIWGIPLVPLGSWVVIEGSTHGESWSGTPISMHSKSIALAYLRAACVAGAAGGLVATCVNWRAGVAGFAPPLLLSVVATALFGVTKTFQRASPEKTLEHARALGLDEANAVSFTNKTHALEPARGRGQTTSTGA